MRTRSLLPIAPLGAAVCVTEPDPREALTETVHWLWDHGAENYPVDDSPAAPTLIHLPLDEQFPLLERVRRWLRPGGLFLVTVGHSAWTGLEENWLGVDGGHMWWSHADSATYRTWISEAGLRIEREVFIPEGAGGHTLILASR